VVWARRIRGTRDIEGVWRGAREVLAIKFMADAIRRVWGKGNDVCDEAEERDGGFVSCQRFPCS